MIEKMLEWVPLLGHDRARALDEIVQGSIGWRDMGDHVWVVSLINLGPCLFCYALTMGFDETTRAQSWFTKMVPESVGPEVIDCPIELLDASRVTNGAWRERVRQHHRG